MPKHTVKQSFVDKDTGERYEKGGTFEGANGRCGELVDKGFLSKEVKNAAQSKPEDFPAGKSDNDTGTGPGSTEE